MAKDTTMSVAEWKTIRDLVATNIRVNSGNTMQAKTAVNYAESLMDLGWIDSEYMRQQLVDAEKLRAEKERKSQEASRQARAATEKTPPATGTA